MKNKSFLLFGTLLMVAFTTIITVSCNKKFDEPPLSTTRNITDTTLEKNLISIKTLRSKHGSGRFELITNDIVIKGIVVGDDKNGNIYKTIYIQDSLNWGIAVKLDGNSLFVDYPVGRLVYIKCKGLCLGDNGGNVQLGVYDNSTPGSPSLAGIPNPLFDSYLVKGSFNNPIVVRKVRLSQLDSVATAASKGVLMSDSLQSTFIQLNDVQLINSDKGLTYADTSSFKNSASRAIEDCDGTKTKTVIYTSGYANFAGVNTPRGKGFIKAIYIPYRNTPELLVLNTTDLQMNDLRCDGTSGAPITNVTSIENLRTLFNGSSVTLPSTLISGVVISDVSNGNIAQGNLVLQDGTGGMNLYFGAVNLQYKIGDSITLDVSGGKLSQYKGASQIVLSSSAISTSNLIAINKVVTPKVMTAIEFNSKMSAPLISNNTEYTLVTIKNATAPTGKYLNNVILTDATGTLVMYTQASAAFSSSSLSIDPKSYTGYGTIFNTTKELVIRNLNDVK